MTSPPRTRCELDLNASLEYGLVVLELAPNELREIVPGASDAGESDPLENAEPVRRWQLRGDLALRTQEQAGLGFLELVDSQERLAAWPYTTARSAAVGRLLREFNRRVGSAGAEPETATRTVCPECGKLLPEGDTVCEECTVSAAPTPTRSLFRLWQFAEPHLGMVGLGIGLTLLGEGVRLIPPYLTIPLWDNVLIPFQEKRIESIDTELVTWYLAGLALAAVTAWLFTWARTYVLAWVSETIAYDVRRVTYNHLLRLSLEYFGGKRTGDLISRVSSDSERINHFLSVNAVDFLSDCFMIVLTSAVLLSIDWKLALAVLLPFPFIAWLIQQVRDRLRHGFGRGYNAWDQMVSVLTDTIPGVRVVKAFAQEERESQRFDESNQFVREANDRVNQVWAFFGPMVSLLTEFGLLTIWIFGTWRVANESIRVGVLFAFFAYISRFYGRLESLSRLLAATERAAAATHRIFEILDRTASVPEPVHPVPCERLAGEVEIDNITFKYGTRQVIHGVSLRIAPGEMIGLVGHSGAGKSTLINLICRFFDVASGAIRVDGVDIRNYPVEAYRANIGIVLQDPFLFFGTVAENIAYGRQGATREEIIAAAKAAHAHDFILRLPDGYDSIVGERGQSLSGGERQRISIARALLIDPRILILDEATSSVDTETERIIQSALDNLIRGRTTIAIAHRLSTLRRADRLVVIERGRIVEVGPHDELVERDGKYAQLYAAQAEIS